MTADDAKKHIDAIQAGLQKISGDEMSLFDPVEAIKAVAAAVTDLLQEMPVRSS